MTFMANLYNVVHLVGLFIALAGLGGLTVARMNGPEAKGRKLGGIAHGVGMLLALTGGFGLMARLGHDWAPWLFIKIGIWLLVAASPAIIRRKPDLGVVWFLTILALVTLAGTLGRFQPWSV